VCALAESGITSMHALSIAALQLMTQVLLDCAVASKAPPKSKSNCTDLHMIVSNREILSQSGNNRCSSGRRCSRASMGN